MPTFVWVLIVIALIIGIIIFLSKENGEDQEIEDNNYHDIDDRQYREYVYNSIQDDFKPYLQRVLSDIDAINLLKEKNSKELNQAHYNAMVEIFNKANDIERKIKEYWNSNRFKKDFSYYIGLHYASHLLGDAIKQEQQIIKNSFVECKKVQKQWTDKIDNLKYKQERATGKQRSEISQEIKSCCETHKQISTLASQIGGTNTKYNQRVTQQHMETAKRRDFIASNFGERGRRWKERMHKRAMIRKGN